MKQSQFLKQSGPDNSLMIEDRSAEDNVNQIGCRAFEDVGLYHQIGCRAYEDVGLYHVFQILTLL